MQGLKYTKDMKKILLWVLLCMVLTSFVKPLPSTSTSPTQPLKLVVLSDVHLMAPQLLEQDDSAFQAYLDGDRKLLKESSEILDSISARVLAEHPQVLFICGDLTKDGELVSHRMLHDRYLKQFIKHGIRVFVVPGNHDVNNPHAVIYEGEKPRRTQTVTPQQFAAIYKDCGYGNALARDPQSLSYVAQLQPGLRLLALDACRYEDNNYDTNTCVTGGRLKPATIAFIRKQVEAAHRAGCKVIAMMHHGVVPHFSMEPRILSEYLVDDYDHIGKMLDSLGVHIVFTGHLHSHDVSKSGNLYDVETGSTVSYPHPYRIITVRNNIMDIHTKHLPQVASLEKKGIKMTDKSKMFATLAVEKMTNSYLPASTPAPAKKAIGEMLGQAYAIDLYGDEKPTQAFLQQKQRIVDAISLIDPDKAKLVDAIATSLTTDTPPADNDVQINY